MMKEVNEMWNESSITNSIQNMDNAVPFRYLLGCIKCFQQPRNGTITKCPQITCRCLNNMRTFIVER